MRRYLNALIISFLPQVDDSHAEELVNQFRINDVIEQWKNGSVTRFDPLQALFMEERVKPKWKTMIATGQVNPQIKNELGQKGSFLSRFFPKGELLSRRYARILNESMFHWSPTIEKRFFLNEVAQLLEQGALEPVFDHNNFMSVMSWLEADDPSRLQLFELYASSGRFEVWGDDSSKLAQEMLEKFADNSTIVSYLNLQLEKQAAERMRISRDQALLDNQRSNEKRRRDGLKRNRN